MLDKYSEEARWVIFCARVEAGNLGGPNIDVDHLLAGIVMQDQNDFTGVMSRMGTGTPGELVVARPSMGTGRFLFESEVAAALLAKIKENPQSPVLPTHVDMALSKDCGKVLQETEELARELNHARITPLHLLAAALSSESSRGAAMLRELGITREFVLSKLCNDGE